MWKRSTLNFVTIEFKTQQPYPLLEGSPWPSSTCMKISFQSLEFFRRQHSASHILPQGVQIAQSLNLPFLLSQTGNGLKALMLKLDQGGLISHRAAIFTIVCKLLPNWQLVSLKQFYCLCQSTEHIKAILDLQSFIQRSFAIIIVLNEWRLQPVLDFTVMIS